MYRNSIPAAPAQPEEVRFQISLLRLLCPSTASPEHVTALEQLLHLPKNLAPAN